LAERFGERMGRYLKSRSWFYDDTPVQQAGAAKSRSNERTFPEDIADHGELEEVLTRLAEELCATLRRRGVAGRSIGIKVRLDDWTNATRSHTIDQPTNDPEVVGPIALELLRAYDPQRPVRLLGVRVASFGSGEETTEPEPTDGQLRLGLAS
ncbi:MAG TPA: hypothetical protein VFJ61_02895, partial [Solirubrobacterales bacterium]|nr:hypothetical protein [Solirubrobacterales bacterium]